MYMLLYKLVNFFISDVVELRTDGPLDWNCAVSLSAENSTFNALNYGLFVASKSTFISNQ